MGVRLTEYMADKRDLTVSLGSSPEQDLHITYRPHVLTPSDVAALSEAKGLDAFEIQLGLIQDIIIKWDLLGPVHDADTGAEVVAEDVEIPVTVDVLRHISNALIAKVFAAMTEDASPKSTSGTYRKSRRPAADTSSTWT